MILPTMTYKEMYDHLAADKKKVDIKIDYLLPKAIKSFKKTMRFPAWELYDYTIPSTNNKYVIYFYAESRARIENPEIGSFTIVHNGKHRFIVKWGAGGYKHTPDGEMMAIRQIHAYTPHFLQRYNERFLKNESLTINEIAAIFLSRNKRFDPLQQNSEINRNYEKYGITGKYSFLVRDGICFSYLEVEGTESADGDRHKDKIDALYICYTTFMNESKMTDSQRKAIHKEHRKQWLQFAEDFQKEAKDGVITLKLEP